MLAENWMFIRFSLVKYGSPNPRGRNSHTLQEIQKHRCCSFVITNLFHAALCECKNSTQKPLKLSQDYLRGQNVHKVEALKSSGIRQSLESSGIRQYKTCSKNMSCTFLRRKASSRIQGRLECLGHLPRVESFLKQHEPQDCHKQNFAPACSHPGVEQIIRTWTD